MSNNYADLRRALDDEDGAAARCAERLLAMRERLAPLRGRRRDASLLLATWNIRDFDSNKFGWGPRRPETFYYIAEIIACFDLVAIQEVSRDMSALERVMRILGRDWDYIVTDATEGAGGNGERMAFVFNTDKVWFRKVAGEIVLPDGQLIVSARKVEAKRDQPDITPTTVEMRQQFARTPFLVAFQAGWFRFSLCTVHIYYGADSGERLRRRVAEIRRLVEFFADRQDAEEKAVGGRGQADESTPAGPGLAESYILLGDFNVVSPEHETMAALRSRGFVIPEQIDGRRVREAGAHFYDQIAVRATDPRFAVIDGGMVDVFADVFRDDPADLAIYRHHLPDADPEDGGAKTEADRYRSWRTWQMSDHSPLWVEIATDFTDSYLTGIARPGPA